MGMAMPPRPWSPALSGSPSGAEPIFSSGTVAALKRALSEMYLRHFRAMLPAVALAYSTTGVVPANTINIENRPLPAVSAVQSSPSERLLVTVEQESARTESFSWTIAGDYVQFVGGSAFLAEGDGLASQDGITLAFEFSSGYAPPADLVQAIGVMLRGN
jgi:hypothetical protein